MKRINYTLLFLCLITSPYTASAHDLPEPSFTLGTMLTTDKGLDALSGTDVTINDNDIVANLTVDYYISPSLAFEVGVISGGKASASLPTGDSGSLHGKSYSASGALTITAETNTIYLFGVKYGPPSSSALSIYGKAGMLFWDVDYIVSGSGTLTYDGTAYYSKTFLQVDGSDPFIGLGMSYAINKNTSLAFDYISPASTNAINGVTFDVSGFSVSWLHNF